MIALPFGLPPIHWLYLAALGALLVVLVILLLALLTRGVEQLAEQFKADQWKRQYEVAAGSMTAATSEKIDAEVRAIGLEADLLEIKTKIWGDPPLDRELHHVLEWIDEARTSTFYHRDRAERYRLQGQMNLGLLESACALNTQLNTEHAMFLRLLEAQDAELKTLRKGASKPVKIGPIVRDAVKRTKAAYAKPSAKPSSRKVVRS